MVRREVPAYAAALRRARAERGWSRPRLAHEVGRAMRQGGEEPPGHESLVRMLRAWENGEHRPDGHNREQLAKVLGAASSSRETAPRGLHRESPHLRSRS
jgi:ribosome-binding protein aMBF1 (putative translation factor)